VWKGYSGLYGVGKGEEWKCIVGEDSGTDEERRPEDERAK